MMPIYFVLKDQIKQEVNYIQRNAYIRLMLILDLQILLVMLSTRPEKRVGSDDDCMG